MGGGGRKKEASMAGERYISSCHDYVDSSYELRYLSDMDKAFGLAVA